MEPVLAGELQDYRVLHLGTDGLVQRTVPAVHRLAIYTAEPGLSVTMAQWVARVQGRETTRTFTFPTADSDLGIDGLDTPGEDPGSSAFVWFSRYGILTAGPLDGGHRLELERAGGLYRFLVDVWGFGPRPEPLEAFRLEVPAL